MPTEFVHIGAFGHEIEAHLSGMRLEWVGIRCFYFDEHVVAVNWLYSFAVGRVKLTVAAGDARRAVEILREKPSAATVSEGPITYDPALPRCPQCNSPETYPERFARRLGYAIWLLLAIPFTFGIPLPIRSSKWKCMDCGRQWKPGEHEVHPYGCCGH